MPIDNLQADIRQRDISVMTSGVTASDVSIGDTSSAALQRYAYL